MPPPLVAKSVNVGGPQTPGRRGFAWAASALILIGAGLRFAALGQESVWGDEVYSLDLAARSIAGILRGAAGEVHPPLYFLLLKAWLLPWGDSLVAARAFSAFASVLALVPFAALARRLLGARAGLAALTLLALSPFQLWYAQETRMYALLIFWEAWAFAAYAAMIDAENRGRLTSRLRIALIAASLGAVFTHFYFVFIIGVVASHWAGRVVRARLGERANADARGLMIYCVCVAAAAVPGLIQMTSRARSGQGVDWLPPLSWGTFVGLFRGFDYGVFIAPKPWWIVWLSAAGLLPLVALGASSAFRFPGLRARANSSEPAPGAEGWPPGSAARFLILGMALLMGAPLLISVVRPIVFFGQRYLIVATLPFYLLAGLGLKRLDGGPAGARRARAGRAAGVLALAVALGVMIRWHVDYFDSRQKRPFDIAAARLDAQYRDGDSIVVNPEVTGQCLRRYLRKPFRIVVDAPDAERGLNPPPGGRIWFVTPAIAASPTERRVAATHARGRTDLHEVRDIPGLVLRATPYARAER